MKNRILTFIIGVLIGAIIATTAFLVYSKKVDQNTNQNINPNERIPMNEGGKMQPPNQNMGEPRRACHATC